MNLPLKRGRPRNSVKTKMLLEESQTSAITQFSLNSQQENYISTFRLAHFENGTWQYFLSKGLHRHGFDSNVIEQLKIATKQFMLSELEYIAVISLLQQEKVLSLNIPLTMLVDSSCFVVKLQMNDNKALKLLKLKLGCIYPCFDEITEKIRNVSVIEINHLNVIYNDFQKIMIHQTNYSVKVGEIVRNCTPYFKKSKLAEINEEFITKDLDEIISTSKTIEIDSQEGKFLSLAPIQIQEFKDFVLEVKKTLDKRNCLFNNHEFENGYYVAEEFDSIE